MEAAEIIIIEDEILIGRNVKQTLEDLGYEVLDIVGSGEEALAEISELEPDLALVDIKLAGDMDGIELAENLNYDPEVPVVFLTAHADKNTVDRAKKVGAYGYITKPINKTDLRNTLEVALYKHEMERKLQKTKSQLREEIEERKKQEKKLRRSNEELRQFANKASHDLKQPLLQITGYADLLKSKNEDKLDEESLEFIEKISTGTHYMKELLESLVRYGKLNSDPRAFETVDPGELVEVVRQNMADRFEELGASLNCADLPAVRGDPAGLKRIFHNLFDNALKFRNEEPPEIEVKGEPVADNMVEVEVADNGVGMESEYTERIFEIFRQLNEEKAEAGIGIGLAVCKKIVNQHDGRIRAESEPGEGLRIYFTLPAAD